MKKITIRRTSKTPVHEQVVEQLRYLIASGHYQIDQALPSTRVLAKQLGISFHTVRKAYHVLEQEGQVEAKMGSGFRVKERTPLSKSDRLEQGADIVQEAVQKLIGLGLRDEDVESLVQEQFDLLAFPVQGYKVVFAAPFREMAALCAKQISDALQHPIEAETLDRLERHHDADYILARFADLHRVLDTLPNVDALGMGTYLTPHALDSVARLLSHETLGLVTRYGDAIQPLMSELRTQTNFSGQTIATSIEDGTQHLLPFLAQADLIVYTPACRRRLLPLLDDKRKHSTISPHVSRESLDRLRQLMPL